MGEWGRGSPAAPGRLSRAAPRLETLVAGLRFRRGVAGTRLPTRLRQRRHLARRGQAALLAAAARRGAAGVGENWAGGSRVYGFSSRLLHLGEVERVKSVIRTHILYNFFYINIFLLACGACIQFVLISNKNIMHMW